MPDTQDAAQESAVTASLNGGRSHRQARTVDGGRHGFHQGVRPAAGHACRQPQVVAREDEDAAHDFGTHISLRGHVVSIKPDEGLADIDRLSRHFLGRDYPARDSPLVTVHVAIDRWFGWSGGRSLQY
ncbi:hypothetical protein [Streptomyces sp. CA-179760]|uniref:hypothetical protein n=1 Tax=Streptomyces sp. CA-179760 TaxID=3240054 RepID=UPI003D90D889